MQGTHLLWLGSKMSGGMREGCSIQFPGDVLNGFECMPLGEIQFLEALLVTHSNLGHGLRRQTTHDFAVHLRREREVVGGSPARTMTHVGGSQPRRQFGRTPDDVVPNWRRGSPR